MPKTKSYFWFITTLTFLLFLSQIRAIHAVELQITPVKDGEPFSYTFTLDQIDNLAGMKLTISYPKEQLIFKSAAKQKSFKSFMHVVNDKNPGQLTIVMASAKGVSGSNLPIVNINFTRPHTPPPVTNYSIKTVQCQLMSESLQEISCSPSEYAITNLQP